MAKLHVTIAKSNKPSPKYTGPRKIISASSGNKFQLQNIHDGEVVIKHFNDLKKSKLSDINSTDKVTENSPETLESMNNGVPKLDSGHLDVTAEATKEQSANVNDYKKKLKSFVRNVNTIKNDVDEWEKKLINEHSWNIKNTDEFGQEGMLMYNKKRSN